MKAIANALFVVVLAVMMATASALFTAGYTSVLAKKSKDSSSGSSNSDNGDKGPSDPSKENTKDLTSDDSKVEPGIPDGVPAKDSDDDNTVRIPEQGWVDGKWTGGTDEMFNKGPNGDGKIPQGCTPGGCISQSIQSPPASAQS